MATEFEGQETNETGEPAGPAPEPAGEPSDDENWEPKLLRGIQARPLVSVLAAVALGYVVARLVTRAGRL